MTSLPADDVPQRFDEYGYGMVIADGMGAAGEPASRLAITTLVGLAIEFGRWHVRINEPIAHEVVDRLERFYRSIDSTLLQATYNGDSGLRTTLSAVFSAGNELFFAHVGHSRAYLFRDDRLTQLTRDHTLAGEGPGKSLLLEVGDGAQDPRRGTFVRFIGFREVRANAQLSVDGVGQRGAVLAFPHADRKLESGSASLV